MIVTVSDKHVSGLNGSGINDDGGGGASGNGGMVVVGVMVRW